MMNYTYLEIECNNIIDIDNFDYIYNKIFDNYYIEKDQENIYGFYIDISDNELDSFYELLDSTEFISNYELF